ncbi:MAG: hypothetical protein V7739_20760 [Motiliproteus sp.]
MTHSSIAMKPLIFSLQGKSSIADISSTVKERLFRAPTPSFFDRDSEIKKVTSLVDQKRLTLAPPKLFRLIPWLLLDSNNGKHKGIIGYPSLWPQFFNELIKRQDAYAMHSLYKVWTDNPPVHLPDFNKKTTLIQKLISVGNSLRLDEIKNELEMKSINNNSKRNEWINELRFKANKRFDKTITEFFNISNNETSKLQPLKSVQASRYSFWRCYFNKGLIQDCLVFAGSDAFNKLSNCKYLYKLSDSNVNDAYIFFKIGNYYIAESIYPGKFYIFLIDTITPPSKSSESLSINFLSTGKQYSHMMSNTGLWQYRISRFLEKSTEVEILRSEYMKH